MGLLAPFDRKVAQLNHMIQEGVHAELQDDPLVRLLSSGIATYVPEFQPLPDPEDLHPCPPPMTKVLPPDLPAMNLGCHGSDEWTDAGYARLLSACAKELPDCSNALQYSSHRGDFTFAELFAGIGGYRLALEKLGGRCVFASEFHPTARAIYTDNWPARDVDDYLSGDINFVSDKEIPAHDILVGGFPCQPFSNLGKKEGLEDGRGRLFWHICRILRVKQPRAALLENVEGLLSCDGGKAMDMVLGGIRESGYRVAYKVLNSSTLLPQRRRRLYIVAIRSDLSDACESFRFPWLPELNRPLADILEKDLLVSIQKQLTISDTLWQKMASCSDFKENPEKYIARLEESCKPIVSCYGSSKSVGTYAYLTQLVPQEGTYPRMLSQRECARLQGFPETFKIGNCDGHNLAWYKRIGNAVSVPIVGAISDALLVALSRSEQSREFSVSVHAEEPLPGTKAALACALDACSESSKQRFLSKRFCLPRANELGLVSVGSLLSGLSNGDCVLERDQPQRS